MQSESLPELLPTNTFFSPNEISLFAPVAHFDLFFLSVQCVLVSFDEDVRKPRPLRYRGHDLLLCKSLQTLRVKSVHVYAKVKC